MATGNMQIKLGEFGAYVILETLELYMYRQIHLMGSGDEVIVLSPAGIYYYSLDMGSITAAKFEVIDTACIVCGRVYVTVRLSARLSVPSVDSCSSVRHGCCRTWAREQEISIDSGRPAARRSAATASIVTLSADVGSWTPTCSTADYRTRAHGRDPRRLRLHGCVITVTQ